MKMLLAVKRAILASIEHSNTAYACATDAAVKAAPQLDAKIDDVEQRIMQVVDLYKSVFGNNHNIKAIFKSALLLLAVPDAPVSFTERKKVNGKTVEQEVHMTAAEAVKLSKHKMIDAGTQVREHLGISRAKAEKRVPRTPTKAPEQAQAEAPKLTEFALCDRVVEALAKAEWRKDLATAIVESHATPKTAINQLLDLIEQIKLQAGAKK